MYLLDTNILSELVKKRPDHNLLQHLRSNLSQSLFTSCICVMELRFGSALRKDFKSFWQNIEREIISRINVIPLVHEDVLIAGDILADLKKKGKPVGIEDVLILLP
jgi:predicted nucleic acid-binding protein